MADSLESVNVAARLYRRWVTEEKNSTPDNRARWLSQAEGLDAAAAELVRLRAWSRPIPASYGDVSDLPPELLAQLSGIGKTDELEDQIYNTVKAAGELIELDRLLIELFRRFGTVHQRRFIINKAYRMAQKGLIHAVPGRKGVYSVLPQEPDAQDDDPDFGGYTSSRKTTPKETFSTDLDDEIPF